MDFYMDRLAEFHRAFGHHVESLPVAMVPAKVKDLRMRLMREELQELEKAMMEEDLVGIADGLADLLYVVFGTAVSYGMPMDYVFSLVHTANMAKLGLDGKPLMDAGGKTIKPPGWKAPDDGIKDLLERVQNWYREKHGRTS